MSFLLVAVNCGNPGAPENGAIQGNNFAFHMSVTFSCDTGFRLGGSKTRFCTANGTWTGSAATCNREWLYVCVCARMRNCMCCMLWDAEIQARDHASIAILSMQQGPIFNHIFDFQHLYLTFSIYIWPSFYNNTKKALGWNLYCEKNQFFCDVGCHTTFSSGATHSFWSSTKFITNWFFLKK